MYTKEEYFKDKIDKASSTKEKIFYSAIYLSSLDGFSNVGIRKLCASVDVKESAFYNHYHNKKALFDAIVAYFVEENEKMKFTEKEIEEMVASNSIETFFKYNMDKFVQITNNPVYFTVLEIIMLERFINKSAFLAESNNLYYIRKDHTEKILNALLIKGVIRPVNVTLVTQEFYYALKGLLDEYLLLNVWDKDLEDIQRKISNHLEFFIDYLKK